AGAGGNLGMGQAARSPGDGYTILFASSSIVVNPTLYSKVPFDIDKDFVPVTKAGATPNSWQINPNFPASTMAALIDIIRKEPGKYSVASPGTGTTPSLSIEMLRLALGLNFVVVPFSGGGPLVQSLLGGHTPIACGAIGNAMALIKERKIRVLAITANKRVEFVPEIPTLDELGIKNQEAETMTGVFVPAGTPRPIVVTTVEISFCSRTVFAAERTYAAWVRTGLLAMASGIGAKALLSGVVPEWLIVATGSVLVLFSAFCFGAAVWRHP